MRSHLTAREHVIKYFIFFSFVPLTSKGTNTKNILNPDRKKINIICIINIKKSTAMTDRCQSSPWGIWVAIHCSGNHDLENQQRLAGRRANHMFSLK